MEWEHSGNRAGLGRNEPEKMVVVVVGDIIALLRFNFNSICVFFPILVKGIIHDEKLSYPQSCPCNHVCGSHSVYHLYENMSQFPNVRISRSVNSEETAKGMGVFVSV